MTATLSILAVIAEQKIQDAIQRGEFNNLAGAGKPLVLEDLSNVPEDLRMAYKILKNAACIPPEIEDRKEIGTLADLLDNCHDEKEKLKNMRKLRFILDKMRHTAARNIQIEENDDYYKKILTRLEKHERTLKTD